MVVYNLSLLCGGISNVLVALPPAPIISKPPTIDLPLHSATVLPALFPVRTQPLTPVNLSSKKDYSKRMKFGKAWHLPPTKAQLLEHFLQSVSFGPVHSAQLSEQAAK